MMPVVYFIFDRYGLADVHEISIEKMPSLLELTLSIFFFMLCEDFTFYWTHRSLHWRVIYPYIHKWHHSYKTTVCIAVEHSHPIEYLYSSLLAVSAGPMLLGIHSHAITVLAWYVIHTCESIDGHCGYAFPWSPFRLVPFSAGGGFHDYHH